MGLFILRLAEDGPAIKDGRIHVSRLLSATLFQSGNCNPDWKLLKIVD